MLNLVLYFQVHQPYRVSQPEIFTIGTSEPPFNMELNRTILRRVAQKCYLPANSLMLNLVRRFKERFKIAFSITGTIMEQFERFCPMARESFKELAETGNVEFLGETYYHSLCHLFDKSEFLHQVRMHMDMLEREFGMVPTTFRNTELIYEDSLAEMLEPLHNFTTVLAEGAERILRGRSPLRVYRSLNDRFNVLLKQFRLSDDIAFRFSDKSWQGYPLTAAKYMSWLRDLAFSAPKARCSCGAPGNRYLNLFMDYETLGEHHWRDTGIFGFFEQFAEKVMESPDMAFAWPREAAPDPGATAERITVPVPVSWADTERDLSAWLSNDMQNNAALTLYDLLKRARLKGNAILAAHLRKLSSSDHLHYMCVKPSQDGNIHRYFSPFRDPEEAYLAFLYALAKIEEQMMG